MSSRGALALGLVLGLSLLAGCAGDEPAPRDTPPPPATGEVLDGARGVLVIVLDGVPLDRLTPYGSAIDTTPALARLAAESVVFEDSIATSLGTNAALASLLVGAPAQTVGVGSLQDLGQQRLAASRVSLAEAFADAGWRTFASVALPQLGAPLSGFDQGFERYEAPGIDEGGARNAMQTTYRLRSHVEEAIAADQPFFALLHLGDAREEDPAPGEVGARFLRDHLKSFRAEQPLVGAALERIEKDPAGAQAELARLLGRGRGSAAWTAWRHALTDGQLAFIDEQLAGLRDLLEEADRWRDCLVVVTGTSGPVATRAEHEGGPVFADSMLRAPLVVRFPGGGLQGRIACTTQNTGAWPTIAGLFGFELPAMVRRESEGEDWLALARAGTREPAPIALCETAALDERCVLDADYLLEAHRHTGLALFARADGRPIAEAEWSADPALAARRARLLAEYDARTPRESWELRFGASGGETLDVEWRFLRGFALEQEASGGVESSRRGLPTRVAGKASLSEPAPRLELVGARRDLPLELHLKSEDEAFAAERVLVGDTPLSRSFLLRVPASNGGEWPTIEAAASSSGAEDDATAPGGAAEPAPWFAELSRQDGTWWSVDLNGPALPEGAEVELVVALYPPGPLDEELVWRPDNALEIERLPSRLDALRVRGRAPFRLQVRRIARYDLAVAIEVDGRQLETGEMRAFERRFSAPGELRLYLPDWMAGVTDPLDRPAGDGGATNAAPPSGHLRIRRSGTGLAPEEREGIPHDAMMFLRRLGGSQ